MNITAQEYQAFQVFLRKSCGIEMGDNKQYLVKNRLLNILQAYKLNSLSELLVQLNSGVGAVSQLQTQVIDAMTTNETFWFRDDAQFQALQYEVMPEISRQKKGAIKIWSAACSSGQEPYTISMCVAEWVTAQSGHQNVQILGTDISDTMLNQARTGIYSEMAIERGLSSQAYARYFQKVSAGHQLSAEIMRRTRFQKLNLLQPFVGIGTFDVIFCRNVLIYFSEAIKRDILQRLIAALEPGGYLFLSSTESMPLDLKLVEPVRGQRARYFKKMV